LEGQETVEDELRTGRLVTATSENMDSVQDLMKFD
jgi:hypothetical protein